MIFSGNIRWKVHYQEFSIRCADDVIGKLRNRISGPPAARTQQEQAAVIELEFDGKQEFIALLAGPQDGFGQHAAPQQALAAAGE